MRVIQATVRGMCFGVRDALETAFLGQDGEGVTVWGELVHNGAIQRKLEAHGYRMVAETDREGLPETERVLITAHGISDKERRRLLEAGKQLIDTTCPLVRRVHETGRRLERSGHHVVVIGRPGHVEVTGIVGDLSSYSVVASAGDVESWDHAKLGVVAQSTTTQLEAEEIVGEIHRKNPEAELCWIDTICDPTKERILALEALLPRVDAVVVVGGRNSNNTRQLVRFCEDRGVPARHVQGPDDLDPAWFAGCEAVGLTAGTSTLDWTIARVHHALRSIEGSKADGSAGAPA